MNHRQQAKQLRLKLMAEAKRRLLEAVNAYMQEVREQGGTSEVVPQLTRLLTLDEYRLRDVTRMNQIASSKKSVAEYVYAHDSAGNVISGAKAVKRYAQYRKSSIAKPASQAEVTIENFVETVGETFTDKAQYEEFSRKVNALVNNDIREPTEEEWEIYHGKFFASLKNQKEIDRHKYWFMNENHGNTNELKSALARVVASEGVERVARRISDNFEILQDMAIAVSIGYKPVSIDALQRVLIILLPNNVREAAMHAQTDYETPFETDFEE